MRARKAHKPRTYSTWSQRVLLGRCGPLISSSTRTGRGRVFKVCNIIDEFTRQHLALRVERRMGAVDVIEMLDLAVLARGAPQVLRADNGPEFIVAAVGRWASDHDTLSKHSYPRASLGWAGSWSPYTTACVMNSWKTTCSRTSTMPALSSAPGRAATMKSTPTARWAGSHPTSTCANGHNATNNNQQSSKHPVHKTRPGHPNPNKHRSTEE